MKKRHQGRLRRYFVPLQKKNRTIISSSSKPIPFEKSLPKSNLKFGEGKNLPGPSLCFSAPQEQSPADFPQDGQILCAGGAKSQSAPSGGCLDGDAPPKSFFDTGSSFFAVFMSSSGTVLAERSVYSAGKGGAAVIARNAYAAAVRRDRSCIHGDLLSVNSFENFRKLAEFNDIVDCLSAFSAEIGLDCAQ